MQKNIDRFTGLHPDIKVDYTPITSAQYVQKIVAEFTAGNEPDALYVYDDSLAAWVDSEYLQPIDGLEGVDKVYDSVYDGNAATMTYQGKRYGLPYYTDSMCLIYNGEILQKAGFAEPPKTLDELAKQAKVIRDKQLVEFPIGLPAQLSDTWWSWWWALVFASGGQLFDDQMKPIMATSENVARDVLTWLQDGSTKTRIIDPAAPQTLPIPLDNAFMAGKHAFVPGARYAARKYNDKKESKIAGKAMIAMVPSLDTTTRGTVSNTRMYCLSATTEKKDQAHKLISYLGGFDESGDPYTARFWFKQRGLGFAFKALADDPEIKAELSKFADPSVYSELAEIARPRRVISMPWYTEFETESQKFIQGALSGQQTPDQAVKGMQATVEKLVRQPK